MDECILRAKFSEFEAILVIKVVLPEVIEPTHGFSFSVEEATMVIGTTKKLRLLIDTRLVKGGSLIKVASSDSRITVKNSRLNVKSANISKFIDEEIVQLIGNTPGVAAEIIAKVNSSKGELKAPNFLLI